MLQSLTDALPWWLLFPLLVVVFLLVTEGAFQLGRRRRDQTEEPKKSHAALVLGSLLALLGLLLGFTFNIADARFQTRRELVLEEANAIGTTYLRADMLPAEHVEPTKELLREYVDVRLAAVKTNDGIEEALDETEELQAALWSQAVASSQEEPDSRYIPLFVQSLNQVIDLHEERLTYARSFRLPSPMLFALVAVALFAMAMIGLVLGLGGSRSYWPTLAMVAAIAAVLALIIELDRPWQQLINVSQDSLVDVRGSMSDP